MVEVRASRLAQEVLADEGDVGGVTRVDVQVGAISDDDTGEVQCSRMTVEVLAQEPDVASTTRVDVQVGALSDDDTGEVQCSRMAVEVLGAPLAEAAATRVDVQVGALSDDDTGEVQCSRMSIECLARQGSAGPVTPLALVDDAHIFLHNWATKAEMRTSFRNSVKPSPDSGAESRRGLSVKPLRSMKLEWQVGDDLTLEDLERVEVFLRRMTDQRFQVPIYMDQHELAASYSSSDSTIYLPTREARFFTGARIGIVQLDFCNQPVSFSFHTISDMTNSQLDLDATLGVDVAAGSLVFPIMDCEVALDVDANYSTARVSTVKVTVVEAPGASQLPPLKSDTPTGAELAHDGRPIWFEEPDWTSGVIKGRDRQGRRNRQGRADFVNLEGDRSRQTHRFTISGNRTEMWNALEFFETRRGRLRSFWHIDQDQYLEALAIDAAGTDVSIRAIGDLSDMQEEFDALGLVMEDGTQYVRDVSIIQEILTTFTIALNTNLPAGLDVNDVVRVARARLVRFTSDEFRETWTHTGLMTSSISVIEVLNESDFTV